MNVVTISKIFTLAELAKAERIIATTRGGTDRITRLANEITIPALPRINDKTGQENDARYFAYLLEYALTRK
jgi:hypothetical protein